MGDAERAPSYEVSVVMPVHNRAQLLVASVASALSQTFDRPFEVIVVDDNSGDGSAAMAEELGAKVVRQTTNLGAGGSRNSGIAAAKGEWIAFLDSDDVWLPDHLATLWRHRRGASLVASSAVTLVEGRPRVIGSPFLRPVRLRQPSDVLRPENIIPTSGCMIRTNVIRAVGGFLPERYAEDLEMWMRVLSQPGTTGVVIPDITVGYRSHDGQTVHVPAMSSGTQTMWDLLESAGRLTVEARAGRRSTAGWDGFRAERLSRTAVTELARRTSFLRLAVLVWRRTKQKQRWRTQRARVTAIKTLFRPQGHEPGGGLPSELNRPRAG
jgi:glycosyltransferase involved in cell wall biosynthesis